MYLKTTVSQLSFNPLNEAVLFSTRKVILLCIEIAEFQSSQRGGSFFNPNLTQVFIDAQSFNPLNEAVLFSTLLDVARVKRVTSFNPLNEAVLFSTIVCKVKQLIDASFQSSQRGGSFFNIWLFVYLFFEGGLFQSSQRGGSFFNMYQMCGVDE